MNNALVSLVLVVVPFIIMLGILVFVHEFGHFITGKLLNVKVLHFAFGFGPWIIHKKIGETEYGIKPFPIGGSVRLLGDPTEAEDPELEVAPGDEKRALFAQPVWKKLIIFGAGSIMNILLAFAVAPLSYWIGIERSYFEVAKANVGTLIPGSPAEQAGIKPGDAVVAINGRKVDNFQDMITTEMLNPGKEMAYSIQRGSSVLKKTLKLAETKDEAAGYSGIFLPGMEPLVGAVQPKTPAEKAGVKPDDKILAIDGQPIHYWHEMTGYIQASKGKPLDFEIQRGTGKLTLSISPEYLEREKRYVVGIEQKIPTVFVRYGFIEGCRAGFGDAYYWAGLTVRIIGKLFSGQVSPKAMSGPLGIAALAGQAWQAGISRFIVLIVIISVNLGILNLIPIPPLDGAHILIVVIEAVTRRALPKQVKEYIFSFFFFLLIGFMVYVTFNDLARLKDPITGWFQQFQKSSKEK